MQHFRPFGAAERFSEVVGSWQKKEMLGSCLRRQGRTQEKEHDQDSMPNTAVTRDGKVSRWDNNSIAPFQYITSRSIRTSPNQTSPNQTKPNQTKPNKRGTYETQPPAPCCRGLVMQHDDERCG